MAKHTDKSAKVGIQPKGGKNAVASPITPASSNERISWRLGDADRNGTWAWTGVETAAHGVLEFLAELDKLTWAQAAQGAEPRCKAVAASGTCKEARDRLIVIQRDDEDDLYELRLGNKPRIWGVRRGHTFHVLWWDPEHTVWPSAKKNT